MRDSLVHYARVTLREAKARRHQRAFSAHLLNSAIRATREALRLRKSAQLDLLL